MRVLRDDGAAYIIVERRNMLDELRSLLEGLGWDIAEVAATKYARGERLFVWRLRKAAAVLDPAAL